MSETMPNTSGNNEQKTERSADITISSYAPMNHDILDKYDKESEREDLKWLKGIDDMANDAVNELGVSFDGSSGNYFDLPEATLLAAYKEKLFADMALKMIDDTNSDIKKEMDSVIELADELADANAEEYSAKILAFNNDKGPESAKEAKEGASDILGEHRKAAVAIQDKCKEMGFDKDHVSLAAYIYLARYNESLSKKYQEVIEGYQVSPDTEKLYASLEEIKKKADDDFEEQGYYILCDDESNEAQNIPEQEKEERWDAETIVGLLANKLSQDPSAQKEQPEILNDKDIVDIIDDTADEIANMLLEQIEEDVEAHNAQLPAVDSSPDAESNAPDDEEQTNAQPVIQTGTPANTIFSSSGYQPAAGSSQSQFGSSASAFQYNVSWNEQSDNEKTINIKDLGKNSVTFGDSARLGRALVESMVQNKELDEEKLSNFDYSVINLSYSAALDRRLSKEYFDNNKPNDEVSNAMGEVNSLVGDHIKKIRSTVGFDRNFFSRYEGGRSLSLRDDNQREIYKKLKELKKNYNLSDDDVEALYIHYNGKLLQEISIGVKSKGWVNFKNATAAVAAAMKRAERQNIPSGNIIETSISANTYDSEKSLSPVGRMSSMGRTAMRAIFRRNK